ncbi:hypothetical protein [Phycicoccus avicenniae]|nr:hypothetical protein [Phycicoccus avicenniae]
MTATSFDDVLVVNPSLLRPASTAEVDAAAAALGAPSRTATPTS